MVLGTKVRKRLSRGDTGINPLDEACKQHDISYSQNKDLATRHVADKQLQSKAWERVKANDSSIGERIAALGVASAMKIKRKLGMGQRRKEKNVSMRKAVISRARRALNKKFKTIDDAKTLKEGSSVALAAARLGIKENGGRSKIRQARIIPLPKTGGILPLIPIFAGLSALGSLAGGAAGIAKAVSNVKSTQKALEEANRHNKTMEAIALGGKKGNGLYLRPYKKGLGLFLRQQQQQSKNY